ncbi:hypothetical protein K2173_012459 [Erythroxylum novogranatense]|uniref:Uncharacterized protein n=1 Tax=Erythroxylum novogranatense TaxID=1862640 RepID=A0AAV8SLE2_9ROSI|nr:hypothetical protein K2173_012459 [Erythroxylum novogranatense]
MGTESFDAETEGSEESEASSTSGGYGNSKQNTPHQKIAPLSATPDNPTVVDNSKGDSTQPSASGDHPTETIMALTTTPNTASPEVRDQGTPTIELASEASQPPQGANLSSVKEIPVT